MKKGQPYQLKMKLFEDTPKFPKHYNTNEKANIILGGLKENLPDLYNYIMNK